MAGAAEATLSAAARAVMKEVSVIELQVKRSKDGTAIDWKE
jgi:glycerophosphoryl diester phosphodiesterase